MKNWQKIKLNPRLKNIQIKKNRINDLIRRFFARRDFLEVQTPAIVPCAGQEPYLNPIRVDLKDDGNKVCKGYLITSPEYSLKKILVAGFENVFEIAKVFRSEESFGGLHNPEFTMLEWYRSNSDYRQIMKDTENLILFLNRKINHSDYLVYQGRKIDLKTPWPRLSVKQAFLKYAKINLDKAKTEKEFSSQVAKKYRSNDWNEIFYSVFLNEIEPRFPKNRPIIIYDYPLPQASLAKKKNKDSFYAERFEIFLGGMEIANAFSELTCPKEQLGRLKEEQRLRKKLKKSFIPIDEDFIFALKLGLSDSGGIALGLDRLQMLLLNIKDINDLLIFPAKQLF